VPYRHLKELPAPVRDQVPRPAQLAWLEAFNSAWDHYIDPDGGSVAATREEAARRVAWAAVKRNYARDEQGRWRPRQHH
jgi:cation transport regulator